MEKILAEAANCAENRQFHSQSSPPPPLPSVELGMRQTCTNLHRSSIYFLYSSLSSNSILLVSATSEWIHNLPVHRYLMSRFVLLSPVSGLTSRELYKRQSTIHTYMYIVHVLYLQLPHDIPVHYNFQETLQSSYFKTMTESKVVQQPTIKNRHDIFFKLKENIFLYVPVLMFVLIRRYFSFNMSVTWVISNLSHVCTWWINVLTIISAGPRDSCWCHKVSFD